MTEISEPALDEPTLRAVIDRLKIGGLYGAICTVEAMLPKPVSWAEKMAREWKETLPPSSKATAFELGGEHAFDWLEDHADRWPQPERATHDPYAHADGSRECRPVEEREKPIAWREDDSGTWLYHEADSELGRHIAKHQKAFHGKTLFPLYTHPQSDPDAEKRGMMKVVEFLEKGGWWYRADEIRDHFGLGEK